MFTGDSSGAWLVRALYETGFANKPISISRDDGLILSGAYITAVVRCAPPANRPLAGEVENCSRYLKAELNLLSNVRVVLALGRLAHVTYLRLSGLVKAPFRHGMVFRFEGQKRVLIDSYHPSRQNTQTKRLGWEMWVDVFKRAKKVAYKPYITQL